MPASVETWRCFIAVPIPSGLRSDLEALVAAWRREPTAPDLRWTDPEGWHVTLAFLGQIHPEAIPSVVSQLSCVVPPIAPFTVSTGRLGAFPRPAAAQSAWIGVDDPRERLRGLAAAVQAVALPPDRQRPLRAHVTLGRSRVHRGEPLGTWLEGRAFPTGELPVREVVLYRSHLGRGPARYEALAVVRLEAEGQPRRSRTT
jgi:2'-5' RNA ligase